MLGHLNAFAKWLAVPLGWPLNGSWRDLKRKDIGIVEDEELEGEHLHFLYLVFAGSRTDLCRPIRSQFRNVRRRSVSPSKGWLQIRTTSNCLDSHVREPVTEASG